MHFPVIGECLGWRTTDFEELYGDLGQWTMTKELAREVSGFYLSSHCEVWWIAESVLNMSRSRNIFTSETEEILLKLNFIVVSHNKIKITIFFINNMSSTVLISCRMKIGLYLLNCHPLNPSILQMMSFVNSTCLKISRIIFCFTTISMKKWR